jgi:hypothetical protein
LAEQFAEREDDHRSGAPDHDRAGAEGRATDRSIVAGHDRSGKLPLARSERDPARYRTEATEDRDRDQIL